MQLWRLTNLSTTPDELLVQLVEVVERREEMQRKAEEEELGMQTALQFERELVKEQNKEYEEALEADKSMQDQRKQEKTEVHTGLTCVIRYFVGIILHPGRTTMQLSWS
jgi:Tfp pilus assembly ATPase PilU